MTAVRTRTRPASGPQRSRTAVRSLPQETIGPRLAVHPRRLIGTRSAVLISVGVTFLIMAGLVAIQAQKIEAQHRIDQLDQRLVDAERRQRDLRVDLAIAESPERIMAEAAALGMVAPAMVVPLAPPQDSAVPDDEVAQPEDPVQGGAAQEGAGSDG